MKRNNCLANGAGSWFSIWSIDRLVVEFKILVVFIEQRCSSISKNISSDLNRIFIHDLDYFHHNFCIFARYNDLNIKKMMKNYLHSNDINELLTYIF